LINESKKQILIDESNEQFSINKCEEHCKTSLDTLTVRVNLRKSKNLRFLIDTGAEISIVRGNKFMPGIDYEPTKSIDVKGISDALLVRREVLLKLFTLTHKTTHLFHVMGDNFDFRYDGNLGQIFGRIRKLLLITVIA
jgi:hypothetical protein